MIIVEVSERGYKKLQPTQIRRLLLIKGGSQLSYDVESSKCCSDLVDKPSWCDMKVKDSPCWTGTQGKTKWRRFSSFSEHFCTLGLKCKCDSDD